MFGFFKLRRAVRHLCPHDEDYEVYMDYKKYSLIPEFLKKCNICGLIQELSIKEYDKEKLKYHKQKAAKYKNLLKKATPPTEE
jgi:hypothetical protein